MNRQSNHFDEHGAARMVDITAKPITVRQAIAEVRVLMESETLKRINENNMSKGDVLAVARLAAISACKMTSTLIPLCHAIPIEAVDIAFDLVDDQTLRCQATVKTTSRTGVEMEALTACSTAALTVYDMCKSIDRSITITQLRLLNKSGGTSGNWSHDAATPQ